MTACEGGTLLEPAAVRVSAVTGAASLDRAVGVERSPDSLATQ
ncbi:hypothetical protein NJ7G_2220 [Natrinema sp. J7-2]|nr:hypothetical protein NJ7G_2220 [Natrinema sp. J7-2]